MVATLFGIVDSFPALPNSCRSTEQLVAELFLPRAVDENGAALRKFVYVLIFCKRRFVYARLCTENVCVVTCLVTKLFFCAFMYS